MEINRSDMGNVTVLRLTGDMVDESAVDPLRCELLECWQHRRVQLVLNLSEVGVVSYMGLGVFVDWLRKIRASHGDMKLVGVNLYFERTMRMMGLTSLFETFDTEHTAVSFFHEAA
ncbi:MAG: STAS domain-containing protein [Candidatus Hydrogenedentota bacterium]